MVVSDLFLVRRKRIEKRQKRQDARLTGELVESFSRFGRGIV